MGVRPHASYSAPTPLLLISSVSPPSSYLFSAASQRVIRNSAVASSLRGQAESHRDGIPPGARTTLALKGLGEPECATC